jgi:hypothetical protein
MRDNTVQILPELLPVKGFVVFTFFHIDWNVTFSPAFQVVKKLGPSPAKNPYSGTI